MRYQKEGGTGCFVALIALLLSIISNIIWYGIIGGGIYYVGKKAYNIMQVTSSTEENRHKMYDKMNDVTRMQGDANGHIRVNIQYRAEDVTQEVDMFNKIIESYGYVTVSCDTEEDTSNWFSTIYTTYWVLEKEKR